jgi:hypothetical protein
MRLMRSAALLLLLGTIAVLAVALVARFSDGPIGPFAGGPFRSGALSSGAEVDWESLGRVPRVELQLVDPPRSRTTHFLVYEGHAYVPCGIVKMGPFVFVGQAFWKEWHREVLQDPRVILRTDGRLYELRAVRVVDPALHRSLSELLSAKYHLGLKGPPDPTQAWFYRLEPRAG